MQHEFGIFGGAGGDFALELLRPLAVPTLLTLHTAEAARAGGARTAALAHALSWAAGAVTMAADGCAVAAAWPAALGAAASMGVRCMHNSAAC